MGVDNHKNSTIDDRDLIEESKNVLIYVEQLIMLILDCSKVSKALFLHRNNRLV